MQVKKKPKKTAKAVPEKSRKKKQPSEDQIKKQPFLKRMLFGEEKPDLSELEAGSTTILDILSPTTVDTKSRDYIIVDDVYHAYLYITGYGYTTTVGTCWLAPLVEAGEGINLSFLVKRQPKEQKLLQPYMMLTHAFTPFSRTTGMPSAMVPSSLSTAKTRFRVS